jgi:hypothetical protein
VNGVKTATADEIYETWIRTLPPDERLRLIERISRELASELTTEQPRRRDWREIAGLLPYPALGEDAQEWVSRTRHEADKHREQQWRHLQEPLQKP